MSNQSVLNRIKNFPLVLVARKAKYEKKFSKNIHLNLFKGVFSTFDEAQKEAEKYNILGYNNSKSAKMYKDMCEKIFPEDYPTLYWLSRINSDLSKLLDFGGHIGIKRYAFEKYLPNMNQVEWKVFDLPKVIEEAKLINKEIDPVGQINISFQDTLSNEKIDLFLALGSFQYIPKSVENVLSEIGQKPKYLLVRVPLTKKKSFVTLNHIGTTVCPYIIRNEDEFLQGILGLGYKLVDKWVSPNKICEIPFHEDHSVYGYTGHLFKL